MPNLKTRLSVNNQSFENSKTYTETLNIEQEVDNTDGFIDLVSFSGTKGTNTLSSSKGFCIYNQSNVPAEIQYQLVDWKNNSNVDEANSVDLGPGSATTTRYVTKLLPARSFIWEDNARSLSYAEDASGANAVTLNNQVPDGNMYVDSTADTDDTTATDNVDNSASNTTVYLEPYTSATNCTANLFRVGDLIRIRDEVMEVTAIGDKSDLANNTLTVKRGLFGTTATSNTDDEDPVRLPFFNMYQKYNAFSVPQTDKDGRFKAMNFFGYGRTLTSVADGIVSGSIAIKFYESGYADMGCTGLTPSSESGLTAGSTYYVKVAVDGGSVYEIGFTVDSNNTKIGGANGVLSKIQNVLDTQFHTTGATLNGVRVTVSLVNGDIRWTSGSRLSTSSIALTAGTSGADTTTEIYGQAIGVFPATIGKKQDAKLPEDNIFDKATGKSIPNINAFAYDDGHGNIVGAATGTINYEDGIIDFVGPTEAQFVVSANYHSAHSGGVSTSTDNFNNLQSIGARSLNSKLPAKVKILAFN